MHIGRWIVLLSIAVASSTARVHLPLVRHHILANRLRIVQFLSCERRLEFQCHRLAHRLNVLAGSADIRRNRSALPALRRLHAHRVGVVLDLQCPPAAVRPLLAAVSAHQLFHRRFVWLLFGRDVGHIVELLAGENVNADAEVTAATEEGADGGGDDDDGDGWSLWDVWNPSFARGGRLNVTLMGRWPADAEQLQAIGQQSKYERRRDLGGLVLKGVLTIADIPANHTLRTDLETTDDAYLDSMNRLNYRLFAMMQDMHNFTIFVLRSRYWGFTVNGTWIGAIGFTVRGDVDICMTALRWSPERFGLYETTTYTYHVRVLFLFRHPRTSIAVQNIFVQPFRPTVWLFTIAVGILAAWLVRKTLLYDYGRAPAAATTAADTAVEPLAEPSWSAVLLLVFGILFQQGYEPELRPLAARCVSVTALFLSLLLFQFYASFIVGSLLVEPPRTIRTVQQLLDSRLQCAIDDVSYVRDIYNHAIDPVAVQLYREKILEPNNIFRLDRGLELLKRGGWAFHTDVSSTYIRLKSVLSDAERCDLQEIAYAKPFACGPALPLGSPLQEIVKISIRRMFEAGLHAYHSAIWERRKPKCAKSTVEVQPIDLEHFSSALYVLAIGMAASTLICAGEIVVAMVQRRRAALRQAGGGAWTVERTTD